MNNASLVGRIVRDLELRYTQNGKAFARFTLAVDKSLSKEKRAELENNGRPTANFISCVVWGKLAENMANYTGKGSLVAVSGEIETGSYQNKEGNTVYTTDVRVGNVQFLDTRKNNDQGNQNNNQGQGNQVNQNNNQQDFNNQQSYEDFSNEGFFPMDNDDIPF